jgi:hypothetical protein
MKEWKINCEYKCEGDYLGVVDVMHFVEDDPLDVSDDVCTLVQHAAKNLGGHNQARRLRLDAHVPRQQPNLAFHRTDNWLCAEQISVA